MTGLKKWYWKLRNKIRIQSSNDIKIAQNVRMKKCTIIIKGKNNQLIIKNKAILSGTTIEIIGNNCLIEIGQDTVIGDNCYLSSREKNTQLRIGKNCMLSRNVKIMTSDGHDILKQNQRINPAADITIGDQVWLADNVTILKGLVIGNNSIVGINSTVTRSVNENSIAAGVPAKHIAEGVHWKKELTFE